MKYKTDEIDLHIIQIIFDNAGITALRIGFKVCLSRDAVLKRTAYLEQQGYISKKIGYAGVYLMYFIRDIEPINFTLELLKLEAPRAYNTLMTLDKLGEATCYQLAETILPRVENQTIYNQLRYLKKLRIIETLGKRPCIYFVCDSRL